MITLHQIRFSTEHVLVVNLGVSQLGLCVPRKSQETETLGYDSIRSLYYVISQALLVEFFK